jgi:hypothetical protein
VSGPVPCSGARRRDKVLDVVSTAIHGGAAAVNVEFTGNFGAQRKRFPVERFVMSFLSNRTPFA